MNIGSSPGLTAEKNINQKLFSATFGVGILFALGIISQFGTDILLAREISEYEFGLFSFVKQTSLLIVAFAFLGMDQAIARKISQTGLAGCAWKSLWLQTFAISSVLVILLTFTISYFYDLTTVIAVSIGVSSIALIVTFLTSSMLRADQGFLVGQFIRNLWRYVLIIAVLLVSFVFSFPGNSSIFLFLFATSLGGIVGIFFIARCKQPSKLKVELRPLYKDAFLFWFLLSSLSISNSLDQLMLAKMSTLLEVGRYSVLLNLTGGPFLVAASSFGYVALPLVVRGVLPPITDRKFLLALGLVVIVLATMWAAAVSPVLEFLFNGKYSITWPLLVILILVGVVRTLYIVPSIILGGKAKTKILVSFLIAALIGIMIHMAIGWLLIPRFGLLGAGIGMLANWTIRCGWGMWLVVSNKKELSSIISVPGEN